MDGRPNCAFSIFSTIVQLLTLEDKELLNPGARAGDALRECYAIKILNSEGMM